MATPPTLIASPASSFITTTTPKTVSLTTAVGDVLVIGATTEATNPSSTPTNTGTAETWTLQKSNLTAADTYIWTAVAAAAQTTTVSVANTSGGDFGIQAWQWRGSAGVGASVAGGSATASLPSVTLVTTGANSAICAIDGDSNNATGTVTFATINVAPTVVQSAQPAAHYSEATVHWTDSGAAGSKTVSMSSPTGQTWGLVAVEILGASAAAVIPDIVMAPPVW